MKFANHVGKYGLSFSTAEEYYMRAQIFQENDDYINETNALYDNFELGHNKFSTYTDAERAKLRGYVKNYP